MVIINLMIWVNIPKINKGDIIEKEKICNLF
jgi:hypothetical protein